jgi:hypothetical protein
MSGVLDSFFCFSLVCAWFGDVARGLRAHAIQVDAQAAQDVDRDAFALAHQAQQQVLGADVVVPHQAGFVHGQFDHALGARASVGLPKGGRSPRPTVRSTARMTCTGSTPNSRSTLTATPVLFFLRTRPSSRCSVPDVVVVQAQRLFLRQRQHCDHLGGWESAARRLHK